MTLNPQVQTLLALFAQAPVIDWERATPADVRATNDTPLSVGDPPHVAMVRAISVPLAGRTLEARLYRPETASAAPPLLVYFHGGGWVIGTLDTHDGTCRALADKSGVAVLSIGYRLAPEHPFPAPLDDCYDALCWAVAQAESLGIDASRVAVGGDSAGANLAGAVAIMARDRHGPALRHQLLLYPVTDSDFTPASYAENGSGNYFLSTAAMRWFWHHYLGADAKSPPPLAAILRTPDLARLPSTTLIAAEYDPLRDEGMAYAARLSGAGVSVDAEIAPGMIHGFISMFDFVPDTWPWIEKAGRQLARAMQSS